MAIPPLSMRDCFAQKKAIAVEPEGFVGENYAAAMEWIAAGKLKVGDLATCYSPQQAQEVYSGMLDQSLPTPAAIFDWRME